MAIGTDSVKFVMFLKHFDLNLEFILILNSSDHFADVLQAPLQPLHDNLNAKIYEVFEKDSVKYIMYQKAIQMALIDKVAIAQIKSKIINVMIVGAGRGPLIRASE